MKDESKSIHRVVIAITAFLVLIALLFVVLFFVKEHSLVFLGLAAITFGGAVVSYRYGKESISDKERIEQAMAKLSPAELEKLAKFDGPERKAFIEKMLEENEKHH